MIVERKSVNEIDEQNMRMQSDETRVRIRWQCSREQTTMRREESEGSESQNATWSFARLNMEPSKASESDRGVGSTRPDAKTGDGRHHSSKIIRARVAGALMFRSQIEQVAKE